MESAFHICGMSPEPPNPVQKFLPAPREASVTLTIGLWKSGSFTTVLVPISPPQLGVVRGTGTKDESPREQLYVGGPHVSDDGEVFTLNARGCRVSCPVASVRAPMDENTTTNNMQIEQIRGGYECAANKELSRTSGAAPEFFTWRPRNKSGELVPKTF